MIEPGPQLALGDLGQAEVEHLGKVADAAVGAEEDVLWLEIAMHDPLRVRLLQRAADLDEHGDRPLDRDRALAAHRLVEVLALEVLHHDVERAVFELAVQEDAHRVGVLQVAHRAGFTAEARHQILAVGELGVKDLHRDQTAHGRL
jgi:hypothetical protein